MSKFCLHQGKFRLKISLCGTILTILFIQACLRASSQFHHRLFVKVFASPMRFFDSTPVGRLLNIFSRDMDESMRIGWNYWENGGITIILCFTADSRLPKSIEEFIQNVLFIAISIGLIVFVFPWFLVALVLFAALFLFFSRIFRCAIRDLKRLENTSRSPIYSHVAATVNGLNTIHAFGKERQFVSKYVLFFLAHWQLIITWIIFQVHVSFWWEHVQLFLIQLQYAMACSSFGHAIM